MDICLNHELIFNPQFALNIYMYNESSKLCVCKIQRHLRNQELWASVCCLMTLNNIAAISLWEQVTFDDDDDDVCLVLDQ